MCVCHRDCKVSPHNDNMFQWKADPGTIAMPLQWQANALSCSVVPLYMEIGFGAKQCNLQWEVKMSVKIFPAYQSGRRFSENVNKTLAIPYRTQCKDLSM